MRKIYKLELLLKGQLLMSMILLMHKNCYTLNLIVYWPRVNLTFGVSLLFFLIVNKEIDKENPNK